MSAWVSYLRSGRVRGALHPKVLVPSISAGVIVALLDIPTEISYAALIFSGALAGYVGAGIGLALFGASVLGLVIALTSSYRGMIALPQDSPAAILALVAVAIVASMPTSASSADAFVTVVATIAITSVLMGLFFLVLGWSKLGSLIRYIPYPVVGGFLAGTGWLLVSGSVTFLTDLPLSLSRVPALFQPDVLVRWLPALVFALLLLGISRRYSHYLVVPGMLLAAIGLFYVVLRLAGTSLSEASAQGWLLGPFPEGALWQPLTPALLDRIYWPAIAGQAGSVATILLVSVVSLLLNTGALELTVRRDMELNRELRSAGLANLLAGLGSGFPGYQTLSLSAVGHRMGANSRLVGISVAFLCGVVLFWGARVLSYLPEPVLGGLLIYVGLTFLVEWLYDAWVKLSRPEYAIVVSILAVIMAVGMLQGVGLGLFLAIVLFVVNYSRISVVRHTLSGDSYRSNVDRPLQQRQILRSRGAWIYILELQGFVFFGTASNLLEQVRRRMEAPDLPNPRFVVLDFRQVRGLDASAVLSFARMKQLAQARGFVLVFTHLSDMVQRQLAQEICTEGDRALWHIEVDLDHGVEWCEEQILDLEAVQATAQEPEAVEKPQEENGWPSASLASLLESIGGEEGGQEHPIGPESACTTGLGAFMERREVPEGHYIIRQGDVPHGLYFVEAGQITAQRECADGSMVRLRKMGPGSVVGEMGLYLGIAASASVVTDQPSTIYHLPVGGLSRMEVEEPEMAMVVHRYIARLVAERLARANDTLQALLEEPS